MTYGELRYNFGQNRYGIWETDANDWYIEGLHCGMCFDVLRGKTWTPTRIEMSDDWYLVDAPELPLSGQRVRYKF